jgi:serine/threonine-protein kinase PpkA
MKPENNSDWRCLNYGECSLADEKTPISLPIGVPFECPKCHNEDGTLLRARAAFPVKPVILGLGGLVLLAVILSLFKGPADQGGPVEPTPSRPPAPPPRIGGVLTDERTGLPRQILTRPKSKLHSEINPESGEAEGDSETTREFERLFVFKEQGEWLNVGNDPSTPKGWLRTEDTIDWPHSLVVEYTSPDNRKPVLFFKDKEVPKSLCDESAPARQAAVAGFFGNLNDIARTGIPMGADYPVLCVEPTDKIEDLYLLPVLEAQMTDIDGYPCRVLKMSAAGRERGATTVSDVNFVRKVVATPQVPTKPLPVDVVFVMDMTGTMQPWVDKVLQVMRATAERLQRSHIDDKLVRMGFWGYQDDPRINGIQFRTRSFINELIPPDLFATALGDLKVNRETADSYPEDVFSGVLHAMESTPWRTGTTRIIVLVGDAPGHVSKEEGGATGMDVPQVRQRANDAGVKIVAAHIRDSSRQNFIKYHGLGDSQFQQLSKNDNQAPAFVSIQSTDSGNFEQLLGDLLDELTLQKTLLNPKDTQKKSKGAEIAAGLLAAAKVDQVSEVRNEQGQVVVPRDFIGWSVDRDLIDPSVVSLEPKLLVSKSDLSTLQTSVTRLLTEARKNQIVGRSFFDGVMTMVAKTTSGQERETLAAAVPKFVSGLPYKSDLMEKTAAWWDSRTATQQATFLRNLEAKLSYYRALNEDPTRWKPLNKGDDPSLHVTALPLTQLP